MPVFSQLYQFFKMPNCKYCKTKIPKKGIKEHIENHEVNNLAVAIENARNRNPITRPLNLPFQSALVEESVMEEVSADVNTGVEEFDTIAATTQEDNTVANTAEEDAQANACQNTTSFLDTSLSLNAFNDVNIEESSNITSNEASEDISDEVVPLVGDPNDANNSSIIHFNYSQPIHTIDEIEEQAPVDQIEEVNEYLENHARNVKEPLTMDLQRSKGHLSEYERKNIELKILMRKWKVPKQGQEDLIKFFNNYMRTPGCGCTSFLPI